MGAQGSQKKPAKKTKQSTQTAKKQKSSINIFSLAKQSVVFGGQGVVLMMSGKEINMPVFLREILMTFLLAGGIFIFASLWTFNLDYGIEANFAGPVGFYLAWQVFFWIGWLAYAIPAGTIGMAFACLKADTIDFNILTIFAAFVSAFLLLTACAGLFELHMNSYPVHQFAAGGQIGRRVVDGLIAYVSAGGANLILIVLAISAILAATELSLVGLFEWLGGMSETAGHATTQGSITLAKWSHNKHRLHREKRLLKKAMKSSDKVKRIPHLSGNSKADNKPSSPNIVRASDNQSNSTHQSAAKHQSSNEQNSSQSNTNKDQASQPMDVSAQGVTIVDPTTFRESRGDLDSQKDDQSQVSIKRTKPKMFKKFLKKGMPSFDLLDAVAEHENKGFTTADLTELSRVLTAKLADFGIQADVEAILPGPVITRFEIQPAPGIKVSRITNLAKDLARSMAVISVRVVEVIPGKTTVGIEIPNSHREIIRLVEVLKSDEYHSSKSPLCLALGKDIAGHPVSADLARMPHLLVAGTTGSGKSVGLNAMLLSLLFKSTPEQVRLILIDPKMLELSVYDDIPHLLTPVVTDMKEAANALRWCVAEMERRYRLMAALGVRNLLGYNRKVEDAIAAKEPIPDPLYKPQPGEEGEPIPTLEPLPYIVVVIDEFADMIMIVGKKVEELIARIAQKARAAGIHLLLATQRPSVDVITGLIKANVPTRIGFQVSSKVDSRTILDQGGAEQLLGHGDMLYLPPGTGLPVRVHGAFVADDEVHRVCDDWRSKSEPDYLNEVLEGMHESGTPPGMGQLFGDSDAEQDPLYDEALAFITQTRKASISGVQRKLKIGYNRAARIVESMEAVGVVSELQSNGQREVLAPPPVSV